MSSNSKTRYTPPSTTVTKPPKADTPDNPVREWEIKVRGRGTSGWMSFIKEDGQWIPLRASETSFISAVAAIEPEIMRVAFPHKTTQRKAI